eukprot:TRINITY_DN2259_c0_g1_i2.p1 TRINITY_DN2259_c0_g1~~TRINITY_DN2259_c0_g1_i2.p1  ORF type:complete len:88 (+),score=12.71 TRINITY_DN2259_c0_g1_i2:44-307(+)
MGPIPGCSGSANGAWDYCYIASGSVELSGGNDDGATNLQVCTGECDTDRQCAEGLDAFTETVLKQSQAAQGPAMRVGTIATILNGPE